MSSKNIDSPTSYPSEYLSFTSPTSRGSQHAIEYGIYSKLTSYERYYNHTKIRHKRLAAAWMLAAFLGIGYALSGRTADMPFHYLIGIVIICILPSICILFLWLLDIGIYHKLLNAVFVESLKLEKNDLVLSRSHHNMVATLLHTGFDPVLYDGLFYAACTFILLLIADIALFMYLYPLSAKTATLVGIGFLIFPILTSIFILKGSVKSAMSRYYDLQKDKPTL